MVRCTLLGLGGQARDAGGGMRHMTATCYVLGTRQTRGTSARSLELESGDAFRKLVLVGIGRGPRQRAVRFCTRRAFESWPLRTSQAPPEGQASEMSQVSGSKPRTVVRVRYRTG